MARREDMPERFTNKIGMTFMRIPAGAFRMGSTDSDGQASDDEKPQHWVTISQPFYLGIYPVTQEQWQAVMRNNPSRFQGDSARPIENVSWNHVQPFLERLRRVDGRRIYTLPSEAQWEYACRAGSTSVYGFGDDISQLDAYAWYYENSDHRTQPVGQKRPNAWGLYDMHGNVLEWCQDGKRTYSVDAVTDPRGPATSANRVLRGGPLGRPRTGPAISRSPLGRTQCPLPGYWFPLPLPRLKPVSGVAGRGGKPQSQHERPGGRQNVAYPLARKKGSSPLKRPGIQAAISGDPYKPAFIRDSLLFFRKQPCQNGAFVTSMTPFLAGGCHGHRGSQSAQHLCADALLRSIQDVVSQIPDHRKGDPKIPLSDALMSAFAMFSRKAPSLLAFDQERSEDNLQRVYGIGRVPCDTSMREILDPVNPEHLRLAFKVGCRELQRGKVLEEMVFVDGHYLIALDGTGYFSSKEIHCDSCLAKHHKNGTVTYSHQMLGAALIYPDKRDFMSED